MNKILQYICNARLNKANRARKTNVMRALTAEGSPLYNRPYIEDGRFHWGLEKPVDIDMFFPEFPLAVVIGKTEYGRYTGVCVSRSLWEESMESCGFILDACRRANIPTLFIGPEDPADIYSLRIALKEKIRAAG